MLDVLLDGI